MRFLLDQDVYASTKNFLMNLGHDVLPVAHLGLAKADDSALLKKAEEEGRIFVTRDRDFGSLVFVSGFKIGLLYLRMLPSTLNTVHEELKRVLDSYSQDELKKAFVVLEPGRHRFRKLED